MPTNLRISTWDWAKHLRLLSKCFREAWNASFHVIIDLAVPIVPVLQSIVPSEGLMFYRWKDPYYSFFRYDFKEYYLATMP